MTTNNETIDLIRLEKAEEEQESYRRRIKLLEVELEKTRKTLGEKEDRLAHLEGASLFIFICCVETQFWACMH